MSQKGQAILKTSVLTRIKVISLLKYTVQAIFLARIQFLYF